LGGGTDSGATEATAAGCAVAAGAVALDVVGVVSIGATGGMAGRGAAMIGVGGGTRSARRPGTAFTNSAPLRKVS
jgi:hypothetical protein